MATKIRNNPATRSKANSRLNPHTWQKPHGTLVGRVSRVGAEHFAIVCIDPAKKRSAWMMADYFGTLLIEPRTLEHHPAHFQTAINMLRQHIDQHLIRDLIITVERTGNYHLAPQRAFAAAGFETRIIHPFATKQFRLPADPGIKTDHTDLFAQHRAAVSGLGLAEQPLDALHQDLRLLVRHRRDLVEKATAVQCQLRESLHFLMPGYAELFEDLWSHKSALPIARVTGSPEAVCRQGLSGLGETLARQQIRVQTRTLEKILAWAQSRSTQVPLPAGEIQLQHRIWINLDDDRLAKAGQIALCEREIAGLLAQTPYLLLLAIPGINVVSAADLAGEMGPIAHYANANALTGRAGLFPSRYQSDETDHAHGPLVRSANRRLRAALMRIADNLVLNNSFFRIRAAADRLRGLDERRIRVRAAKTFTRLAYAMVAGRQLLRHACCAPRHSILDKLQVFHQVRQTPPQQLRTDLQQAVEQLPHQACEAERNTLNDHFQQQRRTEPTPLRELLPALLARLQSRQENGQHTTPGDTRP